MFVNLQEIYRRVGSLSNRTSLTCFDESLRIRSRYLMPEIRVLTFFIGRCRDTESG